MKPFWITLGAILTITTVLMIAGELVSSNRKNAITPEVEAQTQPIGYCIGTDTCTFESEALHELYNNRSKLIYYQNENQD